MARLKFFDKNKSQGELNFQSKLQDAINLIKENKSVVATKVLKVIKSQQLTIHSFYALSKNDFSSMIKDFKEDKHVDLPKKFPPSQSAVNKIESELEGIIYSDKRIYMNSKKSVREIASTLVHEICHFLNEDLFKADKQIYGNNFAHYRSEARAFTAEKIFERNGSCVRRSDIKAIHERVTKSYPEFNDPNRENSLLGYIYSAYDSPLDETSPENLGFI